MLIRLAFWVILCWGASARWNPTCAAVPAAIDIAAKAEATAAPLLPVEPRKTAAKKQKHKAKKLPRPTAAPRPQTVDGMFLAITAMFFLAIFGVPGVIFLAIGLIAGLFWATLAGSIGVLFAVLYVLGIVLGDYVATCYAPGSLEDTATRDMRGRNLQPMGRDFVGVSWANFFGWVAGLGLFGGGYVLLAGLLTGISLLWVVGIAMLAVVGLVAGIGAMLYERSFDERYEKN